MLPGRRRAHENEAPALSDKRQDRICDRDRVRHRSSGDRKICPSTCVDILGTGVF